MDPILIALAGLMGAAGIMLTAAGAHGKPGVGLDSAGYLLLIHAVAVIAGAAAMRSGLMLRPLGLVVLCGFVLGRRPVRRRRRGARLSRRPAVSVRRAEPAASIMIVCLARSGRGGARRLARP